ncbi:D-glycerate 3-kinase [Sinobacterium caligoides]|uniref:D-glycerate 3-kinase n=1 Tax=Sinobacterium caligoides TaxID=933926 RepID=A0A3N2DPG5_9GAMM|nr:hypothetical protein [Sinobacterium caligoides]ROS01693.1 D-glycerate 3-kinase [Sinobacterium caligoides]
MPSSELRQFIDTQVLPEDYLATAAKHFSPLLEELVERCQRGACVVVGINGCQGSGKSTLAEYLRVRLQSEHQLSTVVLSLDDFYLAKGQRQSLADTVHPLLASRGVPGTHDTRLMLRTLARLRSGVGASVRVPRFDKAADDRCAPGACDEVKTPCDIIILEGWCLGATAQPAQMLLAPVNEFERHADSDGRWRRYSNDSLGGDYQRIFEQVDSWVMLRAPSFQVVYQWRLQQEQKLADKLRSSGPQQGKLREQNEEAAALMSVDEIDRFVQFFQRLTEHMLVTLPARVDHLYQLNSERDIIDERHRTYNCDSKA